MVPEQRLNKIDKLSDLALNLMAANQGLQTNETIYRLVEAIYTLSRRSDVFIANNLAYIDELLNGGKDDVSSNR